MSEPEVVWRDRITPDQEERSGAARPNGRRYYSGGIKRLLDIALVLMALPIVVPLILVFAVAVAVEGGQPFYRQERLGRGGRIFHIWKLRSMVRDADLLLEAYLLGNAAARAEWDKTQKLKQDPRITRVGRFLRKSSMDELPQLWNVLKGDMSLVGPRPMMPSQAQLYRGSSYYALRPGITGLWQISERNDANFTRRALLDSKYHERLSLMLDIAILLATVRVVLRGTGY